jgi:hypothetical protein
VQRLRTAVTIASGGSPVEQREAVFKKLRIAAGRQKCGRAAVAVR